jgi:transposase InsO family protein
MDDNMRADLCVEAFQNACRDDRAEGMILHSDRGTQFTSQLFRNVCRGLCQVATRILYQHPCWQV